MNIFLSVMTSRKFIKYYNGHKFTKKAVSSTQTVKKIKQQCLSKIKKTRK